MENRRNVQVWGSVILLGFVFVVAYLSFLPLDTYSRNHRTHQSRFKQTYEFGTDISAKAIINSATKLDHIAAFTVIFILAALVFGVDKLCITFVSSFAFGVFIEVVQGSIYGRSGQVTDLIPDIMGIIIGFVIIVALGDRFK